MMSTIDILLVDDHAVVRAGIRRLLEQYDHLSVVAEVDNGEKAYQCYAEYMPDVTVMDLSMNGMGGIETIRRLMQRFIQAKILVLSMYTHATLAQQALKVGALGYVTKSSLAEDLVTAIEMVAGGKHYLSSDMAQIMAIHSVQRADNPLQILSAREFEIFRLLAEGLETDSIAHTLSISTKTVANYQTAIKQKLNLHNPTELVRLALRCGVIEG